MDELTADEILWLREKKRKEEIDKEVAVLEKQKNEEINVKQQEIAGIISKYDMLIREKQNGVER